MNIDRFVVLVFIWMFICLQIQTAYVFRLLSCVYAYWLPIYCHLVTPYILPFINCHICSYILLVCRQIFRVHVDEFIVGQIIFFGCVQMKRILGGSIKQNELKVLIHPHTPIYLRFCCLVAYFIAPTTCNKTVGVSVQKKRGVLHLKNGAGYASEKPPPLQRSKKTNTLYVLWRAAYRKFSTGFQQMRQNPIAR